MKTVFAATVAVLGVQALAGTNLLANPSFESAGPGVIPFAGWTQQFFGNVFQADVNEAAPLDGSFTCKTYGTFPGPGVQGDTGLIQRVPVTAGETYTATIHVQNWSGDPLGSGNLALWLLQWKGAGGVALGEVSVEAATPATPLDTWTQVVVSGVAPVGAVSVDVFMLFLQFENQGGSIFWDMASLEEGAPQPQPCNVADIAAPFGILDLNDITGFVTAFTQGCP